MTSLSPYEEGRRDYRHGMPVDLNPYPLITDDHIAWLWGWEDEESDTIFEESMSSQNDGDILNDSIRL